jgi:hypothetical protein
MPPFVTQSYLVTNLLCPLIVGLILAVLGAILKKRGWKGGIGIGVIAFLVAFIVFYFLFPPPPGPWEWLDSAALPTPPTYLDPIRKEVGGYSPDPIAGEGRRWVEEERVRNKYTILSTDKKTGKRTELQPLDRKYAASAELPANQVPKRLRVISSDIVLVAETVAKEEDGWHVIGKTAGVPKADADVPLGASDLKAKSYRVVVALFPLTTQAGNTLLDFVEKKSVALVETQ